jgi:hypothetical protein
MHSNATAVKGSVILNSGNKSCLVASLILETIHHDWGPSLKLLADTLCIALPMCGPGHTAGASEVAYSVKCHGV